MDVKVQGLTQSRIASPRKRVTAYSAGSSVCASRFKLFTRSTGGITGHLQIDGVVTLRRDRTDRAVLTTQVDYKLLVDGLVKRPSVVALQKDLKLG